MPSSRAKQSFLYAVALAGIAQGAIALTPSEASASDEAATCCTYTSECVGTEVYCHLPRDGQRPCSVEKASYCKKT
jgi:hypothetical protein